MDQQVKNGVASILFATAIIEADYLVGDSSNLLDLLNNLKEQVEEVINELTEE